MELGNLPMMRDIWLCVTDRPIKPWKHNILYGLLLNHRTYNNQTVASSKIHLFVFKDWYCRTNHPIFSVWCQTIWMENLKNGSDKGLNHLKYTLHYQYSNYSLQSSKFINYSDDIAFSNQHKNLTEQKLLSLILTILKCILEPESWSF